jgi:hypothetical protein
MVTGVPCTPSVSDVHWGAVAPRAVEAAETVEMAAAAINMKVLMMNLRYDSSRYPSNVVIKWKFE